MIGATAFGFGKVLSHDSATTHRVRSAVLWSPIGVLSLDPTRGYKKEREDSNIFIFTLECHQYTLGPRSSCQVDPARHLGPLWELSKHYSEWTTLAPGGERWIKERSYLAPTCKYLQKFGWHKQNDCIKIRLWGKHELHKETVLDIWQTDNSKTTVNRFCVYNPHQWQWIWLQFIVKLDLHNISTCNNLVVHIHVHEPNMRFSFAGISHSYIILKRQDHWLWRWLPPKWLIQVRLSCLGKVKYMVHTVCDHCCVLSGLESILYLTCTDY